MVEHEEELMSLRNDLNTMMTIVQRGKCWEIPFFYRYLAMMKDNIEIYLFAPAGVKERKNMFKSLQISLDDSWNKANNKEIGIGTFEWFLEEDSEKAMLCLKLLEQAAQIDQFISTWC